MPITLAKMAANTATVTLSYEGDSVTVVYYPNKLNDKMIALGDKGYQATSQVLADLLKSWDVYEDETELTMFPLEVERLAELPIQFRQAVIEAVLRDMRPNQAAPTS